MFFLQRLLVSPNRTRPPQRLGGALFEHPHNVSLAKVGAGRRAFDQDVHRCLG